MNKFASLLLISALSVGSGAAMAQGNDKGKNPPTAGQSANPGHDNTQAQGNCGSGKDNKCQAQPQKPQQSQSKQEPAKQPQPKPEQHASKQPEAQKPKPQHAKGDVMHDYKHVDNPGRYGLQPSDYYVTSGNYVYQIDPNTQKVVNLIGAVADILN